MDFKNILIGRKLPKYEAAIPIFEEKQNISGFLRPENIGTRSSIEHGSINLKTETNVNVLITNEIQEESDVGNFIIQAIGIVEGTDGVLG
ncbi:hypothetical protein CWI37_1609p0010 [Hamiltosporidium tvaerminnensis]|uniref:Uncharacterized protein n=1 Tax=Hamiltosporidium tvaerminnensis TaxID=1176355 RepID=A0A4Q9KV46_9MICR|nr:hypothetical protein CWI37_1609p0010 [Hamiltosporidium tvaerminnensis]